LNTHFSEVNENTKAYSLEGHRHLPEMVQELRLLNPGLEPQVTFLPHLIPITRGILSSCYASVADARIPIDDGGKEELLALYRDFYKNEPFVKVVEVPPQTKQTWGNNNCLIYPTLDTRTGRVMVISCIDNLVKGAAGQAVQNMNVMLGLPETMGLEALATYP
ncbi:MAG: Asd/ArgC dimerization domain-containing protein, partial [Dehalococcoidia bacterium]